MEGANGKQIAEPSGATFQINSAKLIVPVVDLSINYGIQFLEHFEAGT